MTYNFDEIMERRGSGSLKWDTVAEGVIPLWVADMDFAAPPALTDALAGRVCHPLYGYSVRSPGYFASIAAWYREQYGAVIGEGEILPGPGTVLSLGAAVRAFAKNGDGVLVMTPVYTPFYRVIRENGCQVVEAPMNLDENGRFVFDPAALEQALDEAVSAGVSVPLLFFCTPHNPGGRVWTSAEIETLLELAERRNMIVAADEIHGDFVYAPHSFVPAASFTKYAGRVITISGANKTFNLGGLHVSHLVIRDEKLKAAINKALCTSAHNEPDVFAERAVEICYRNCGSWFRELKDYLWNNLEKAAALLNAIPGVKTWTPEGTYLLWADIRGLAGRTSCQDDAGLVRRLEHEAKVKITAGSLYGKAGSGYARINAASPWQLLAEGLARIQTWAREHQENAG